MRYQNPMRKPEAVDLPSGEMTVEAEADVPEDLPSGKRSRTEAKEEDVEMDSDEEDEFAPRLGPRPRLAVPAMANFISSLLSEDREFIDELIKADEERQQRRHEEGVRFTERQPREEVRYGEELEERKAHDIFSHTSTREFMEALRPETEENLSSAQSSLEHHLFQGQARQTYQLLHSNKMSLLDPLEPEEKIKIEVPKPQRTEDPMTVEPEYDCALDKLGHLDRYHKNKYFGFYGKYFRESHARSLNFYKYRMPHPVGHPHCLFDFDEEKFMDTYVQLFFTTPTSEDYFHGKPVVYGCEDHRLRVANAEPQEERSRKAKQLFEERQLKLRDMVADADKDEIFL